mgnify:CR=1 FL=1
MHGDDKFAQAARLYDGVGNFELGDGRTVRDACRLVGNVSLWDCLSTYLILYRFPMCVSGGAGLAHSYTERVRPLLGTLARVRDTVLFPPSYTVQGLTQSTPKSGHIRVLFVGFSEVFFRDVLRSVYSALEKESAGYQSIVLTGAGYGRRPQNHFSVWDYFSADVKAAATRGLSALDELKQALPGAIAAKRGAHLDGIAVDWPILRREFSWLCNRELPRLIYVAAAAYKVLSHYTPTLIVTADDADQKSKVVELAARELRTPTLVVQQGVTRADYPDWKHFAGDYVAAMGPTSLETIVGQGVPREAVTVTGHPGLDKLKQASEQENAATRAAQQVDPDEFLVIFASQPYYLGTFSSRRARREMIRACLEAVSTIPGVRLIVKAHPRDDVPALKKLCANYPRIRIVDSQVEVASLIKACDAFITMFSQTTLEALYADKPVININFPGSGVKSPFFDGKATCLAESREDIRIAITKLSEGDYGFFQNHDNRFAKEKMLNEWTFLNDGKATDRVVDLISGICASRVSEQRHTIA